MIETLIPGRGQQRLFWSTAKAKYVRVPYKKKSTKRVKQKYHSKARRAYNAYLDQRYGGIMTLLFSEHLHMVTNRPGFMRRVLAAQRGEVLPTVSHTPKYLAYLAERKPRSRKLAYKIPDNWITWDEEHRTDFHTDNRENKTYPRDPAHSAEADPSKATISKYFPMIRPRTVGSK